MNEDEERGNREQRDPQEEIEEKRVVWGEFS